MAVWSKNLLDYILQGHLLHRDHAHKTEVHTRFVSSQQALMLRAMRPSDFTDVFIPDWIWGSTLSPGIDDMPCLSTMSSHGHMSPAIGCSEHLVLTRHYLSSVGWAPTRDCGRAPHIHHLVHDICDEQTERVYYDIGLLQFTYESLWVLGFVMLVKSTHVKWGVQL